MARWSQPSGRESSISQSATGALLVMAVLLRTMGCVSEPALQGDEELNDLLQAYRGRNPELYDQRRRREEAGSGDSRSTAPRTALASSSASI